MRDLIRQAGGAAPFASTVLISDRNMELEVRLDSVAFLGEPGFHWDGLYGVYHANGWFGGIYRVQSTFDHGGIRMWHDNSPYDETLSGADRSRLDIRPVVGVVKPYSSEFGAFLRDRFAEDWS